MEIAFKTKRLQKTCNSHVLLQKTYGKLAKKIEVRLSLLKNAQNLSLVPTTPPVRRHLLRGDRQDTFAVDLGHPYRLVFTANHDPIPRRSDGGIATEQVTAIRILEITDYH